MLAVEDVVVMGAQLPGWRGEGGLDGVQRARAQPGRPALASGAAARETLSAVQIGEARGVGDMHQFAFLGPAGLGDGTAVGDDRLLADTAVGQKIPHVQGRALPRHARVVPGDPGQVLAVGGQGRGGDEVRPGHDCDHRGVLARC